MGFYRIARSSSVVVGDIHVRDPRVIRTKLDLEVSRIAYGSKVGAPALTITVLSRTGVSVFAVEPVYRLNEVHREHQSRGGVVGESSESDLGVEGRGREVVSLSTDVSRTISRTVACGVGYTRVQVLTKDLDDNV